MFKKSILYQHIILDILFVCCIALGNVVSGTFTLNTGQGIKIIDQKIAILTDSSYGINCGMWYDTCCDDSMFDSVDVSYFNAYGIWDAPGCGGGYLTGIRTKDTLWEIKNVSKMAFSEKLILSDSSMYRLAKKNDTCRMWIGMSYAVKGEFPYLPDCKWPSSYFITKTKSRKYLLLKLYMQKAIGRSTGYDDTCTGKIDWYLQLDGTPDFNGINLNIYQNRSNKKHIGTEKARIEYVWHGKKNIAAMLYTDCLGRKVMVPAGHVWKSNQVLLRIK